MQVALLIMMISHWVSFKDTQLQHKRVKDSYEEKELVIKQYFADKKVNYDGFHLFIRAFKKEQELEVWIKEAHADAFTLLRSYQFCSSSGTLGPKRKEGDLQIPEGIYQINHFNPQSKFYLSLGINYPNASDKILSDKQRPGGAIYIHGNCVTVGCVPLTDDKIKELYVMAVEAKNNGQQKISVHIFPARLTNNGFEELKSAHSNSPHIAFWQNLKSVFDDFEQTKKLRPVVVDNRGQYKF